MTIDDWLDGSGTDDSNDSESDSDYSESDSDRDRQSPDTSTNDVSSAQWVTDLDFSTPYVIVAVDRWGKVWTHKDFLAVKTKSDDWRRVEDDFRRNCTECNYSTPDDDRMQSHLRKEHGITDIDEEKLKTNTEKQYERDYNVIFKAQTRQAWLRLSNLAQDQLGIDIDSVLEESPRNLGDIRDRVHYPPATGIDNSRSCAVCGASSDSNGVAMMTLDLIKHRKMAVCASHSIEELAEQGLLQ